MLLNTTSNFKKDDIITLKNSLGEEIVCTLVSEDGANYIIKNPYAIGMTEKGPMLVPPVVTGDMTGEIPFPKSHVMWAVPTDSRFQAGYTKEVTGIDLLVPDKKIIV